MTNDTNDHEKGSGKNKPWAPEWSSVDRRNFLLTLGVTGAGASAGCLGTDDEADEEITNQIGELFEGVGVLITGSPDLLVAEYRSEALQTLYTDIQEHDSNGRSKRTLLEYLDSAREDNRQVMKAVLDLDPETASAYSQAVESNISRIHQLVEAVDEDATDSWRAQAETIIKVSEGPLSVLGLIEEEEAVEAWWEAIEERGDKIAELFQELEDRGYEPTVEERDGEFGISVNPFITGPAVGFLALAKLGIASAGVAKLKLLGLSAVHHLGGWAVAKSAFLTLKSYYPVILSKLAGASVSSKKASLMFMNRQKDAILMRTIR